MITSDQAAAIRVAEAAWAEEAGETAPVRPAGESSAGSSRITTALAYLGGSVLLVGGIVAASRHWSRMGSVDRLLLVGGAAFLLFVAGSLARRTDQSSFRQSTGFLWLLSAAAAAFFTGLFARELLDTGEAASLCMAGLGGAIYGAVLWRARRAVLQELAVFLGLVFAVEALLDLLPASPTEFHGLPLWCLGAVWGLLAWGGFLPGPPERGSAYALASTALLVGAQLFAYGGPGLALGIGTAIALMALSVPLGLVLLLAFGASGVLLFLPQIVFEHFGDALGAAPALILIGAALLGAARVTARLKGSIPVDRQALTPRRRRALASSLSIVAVLTVAGSIWACGILPLPNYTALAAEPDPAIAGRVAFVRAGETCVYAIPASGGPERRVLCAGESGAAFWSPITWTREGRILLSSGGPTGPAAIVVDPATGRTVERIDGYRSPAWQWEDRRENSGRGRLRLGSGYGGEATIAIVPRDSSPREIVRIDGPPNYAFPRGQLSPDGEWILAVDTEDRLVIVRTEEGAWPRLLAKEVDGDFAWYMPGVAAFTVDLDSLRAEREP